MLCALPIHLSLEAFLGQMEDLVIPVCGFPRVHIAKSIKGYVRIKMEMETIGFIEGIMF